MSADMPFAARPSAPPSLYAAVWRWHLYAGLFCIPFIIALALTGSIYLFKPQIEAWRDRPYDGFATGGVYATSEQQVAAALAAVPGGRLRSVEVRPSPDDALRVNVAWRGEDHRVLVHPATARVLAVQAEDERFTEVVRNMHGELLMGDRGSIIVELAASWAIVMILSGLYLWWPRNTRSLAGVIYPRLSARGRVFWRDLHAVTGFWISILALCLLVTGLPWTSVWGDGFKAVRRVTGTAAAQDWSTRRPAADDRGHAAHGSAHAGHSPASIERLDRLVGRVRALDLPPPVLLSPPKRGELTWVARSDTPNRPLRRVLELEAETGRIMWRETFKDRHPIDQAVGYGIAAHEGQLFGMANQILGLLTAIGLVVLASSGAWMWWRRRPSRSPGPLAWEAKGAGRKLYAGIGVAAVLLPLFGLSLVAVAAIERAAFALARQRRALVTPGSSPKL